MQSDGTLSTFSLSLLNCGYFCEFLLFFFIGEIGKFERKKVLLMLDQFVTFYQIFINSHASDMILKWLVRFFFFFYYVQSRNFHKFVNKRLNIFTSTLISVNRELSIFTLKWQTN